MGRFLYFVILLILARYLWTMFAGLIAGEARRQMGGEAPRGQTPNGNETIHKGKMVRDPVCGLHLPEHRALSEVRDGERFHFCSDTCRQSFLKVS